MRFKEIQKSIIKMIVHSAKKTMLWLENANLKDWKKSQYESNNSLIDSLILEGKVKDELGKLITQVDLEFKSPSSISNLLTGYAINGWEFFPGLDELRK